MITMSCTNVPNNPLGSDCCQSSHKAGLFSVMYLYVINIYMYICYKFEVFYFYPFILIYFTIMFFLFVCVQIVRYTEIFMLVLMLI